MTDNPLRAEILSLVQRGLHPPLSEDETNVLELRWGLKTGTIQHLSTVADLTGKSKEQVRLLEVTALRKLRGFQS